MQEFTFATFVECLHSYLPAKLLCTTAHMENMKHAKKKIAHKESRISAHDTHIQQQYIDVNHTSDFSNGVLQGIEN